MSNKVARRLPGKDNRSKIHYKGLMAATFIARSLAESKNKEWIVAKFGGDEQLVNMWISFVHHSGWVKKNHVAGKWSLTDRGKRWVDSFKKGFAIVAHTPLITLFTEFDFAVINAV